MSFLGRFWHRGISQQPLVAVVHLQGILASTTGRPRGPQSRRVLNARRAEPWLQLAFNKYLGAHAVAFLVNCPDQELQLSKFSAGGSPVQAELMASRIEQLSKESNIPAFTFAEDVAASGGYWLMCAGKRACALRTSIVGSIGVVSPGFGFHEAIKKLGIERRLFTSGEAKGMLDPFKPVEKQDVDRVMDMLQDLHEAFKEHVNRARGKHPKYDPDKHKDIFSGRAWTGHQARELGLIDDLTDHVTYFKEMYGKKVQFRTCSIEPAAGLAEMLGFNFTNGDAAGGSGAASRVPRGPSPMFAVSALLDKWRAGRGSAGVDAQAQMYGAARAATAALLDEMEERAEWAKYGF